MSDVGKVADVVGKVIDVGEKITKEVSDENERDKVDDWQQRWDAAIAAADADAMDILLAERRRADGLSTS